MSVRVIYESMFGNTEELAHAVARGLGDVQVLEVSQATQSDVQGLDLVVLGGPTHAFSMSRPATRHDAHKQGARQGDEARGLRELIAELPKDLATPIAVFDTRVGKARKLPGSAAKSAARELLRHHHTQVVARESFYVEDVSGPLLDGEAERATAWGRTLSGSVARTPDATS